MNSDSDINLSKVGAKEVLAWGLDKFGRDISLACSFSLEDIVIAHMMIGISKNARIFAIDTGRLNEETYQVADALRRSFRINIEWHFPRHEAVEELENKKGLFSFRENLEARLECCRIRKVEPLSRALSGLKAWVTGLRQEQSVARGLIQKVEKDDIHGGITKINPLADWKTEDVWDYIRQNHLPYNRLYDLGYKSIGCAPCTREVMPGEEERAGRWWWENPEHKECGLHIGNHSVHADNKKGQDIKK